MQENSYFWREEIRFVTTLDLMKYCKLIKQQFRYVRTSYELPSDMSTGLDQRETKCKELRDRVDRSRIQPMKVVLILFDLFTYYMYMKIRVQSERFKQMDPRFIEESACIL